MIISIDASLHLTRWFLGGSVKRSAVLIFVLFTLSASGVCAQGAFSLAAGLEGNGYSLGYRVEEYESDEDLKPLIGIGPKIAMDYRFGEMFSIGSSGIFAIDIGSRPIMTTTSWEVDLNIRWYFLRWPRLVSYYFMFMSKYHFFVQFDIGMGIIKFKELPDKDPADLEGLAGFALAVGGTLGCRIYPKETNLFVELFGRFGKTSKGAGGILVGYSFYNRR
ncbi:MAG: hypothetical protein Ta2F_13200 [Termitinemataceae bacterium]|nr:MAG: hypothetical protein Ta2F_13200 [Termitinemataceae bacterium]